MSAAILPNLLRPLREAAPAVTLRVQVSNEIQNLMRREADIAIRHARPSLNLDKAGRPRTLREVADQSFIGTPDPDYLSVALQNMGIPLQAERFMIQPRSSMVAWEIVKAGHGVSMLPEVLGEAELQVEKVYSDLPSLKFPIWLVTHREIQTSPRIRTVFDFLANQLGRLAKNLG